MTQVRPLTCRAAALEPLGRPPVRRLRRSTLAMLGRGVAVALALATPVAAARVADLARPAPLLTAR
ncbi:hypothetical protein OPKNFCMD_1515 [Methylobacterium crusticola]|uniref:Uncharacterized protein n=1 Tax=Methylobacterium crusticola TaxID=1697972 RepID=A0ABQ4QV12_9HYPH|nr:hypothetical protein [Methylobacterium crusticola]GJD48789.1 hypothetical protein OPKNFCMD_1515 [Methylobacterium crusticola]